MIETLKRLRLITLGIGLVFILAALFASNIIYGAGARDIASANEITQQIRKSQIERMQLDHLNGAVHTRARMLLPYCKMWTTDPLFQHALLVASGLSATLTGSTGIAPQQSGQPSQQVAVTAATTPAPTENLLQHILPGKANATNPSAKQAPPQLQTRSMGENITGPFLLIMRALSELQTDPAVLSANVTDITQAPGDTQTGSNAATVTVTMTQATIDPDTCKRIRSDAHLKIATLSHGIVRRSTPGLTLPPLRATVPPMKNRSFPVRLYRHHPGTTPTLHGHRVSRIENGCTTGTRHGRANCVRTPRSNRSIVQ